MAAGRRVHLGHASHEHTCREILTLLCCQTAGPTATTGGRQHSGPADLLLLAGHSWVGLYEGDVGE